MDNLRSYIRTRYSDNSIQNTKFDFPNKEEISKKLSIPSHIKLNSPKTEFVDELHNMNKVKIVSNYSVLDGNWRVSTFVEHGVEDEYFVRLSPESDDTQSILLSFPTAIEQIKFINEMSSNNSIKQDVSEIDAASVINEGKKESSSKQMVKTLAVAAAAIGTKELISKVFSKR
jgi:hypothetical protein